MVRPDLHLPSRFVAWLAPFLAVFSRRARPTATALAIGALLTAGPRTVTNCLRTPGLADHPGFTAFHRILNRNAWSGLALARTLLHMVVAAFVPSGPNQRTVHLCSISGQIMNSCGDPGGFRRRA